MIKVLDDKIVDIPTSKKLNPTVIELFIRSRNLNISHVFITQLYFVVPKNIRITLLLTLS